MNFKNFNYFVSIIYLISTSFSYSIDFPDIKNLVIHKENKKINYVEFLKSNSEKVSLEDFDSNLIIINFWATWCAPCVEEMPSLSLLKKKNEFKDIEIIPINIGNEKYQKSKKFFEELNIDNLEIFSGNSIELAKEFKLRGIPTTIFINKEGYEFARIVGIIDFENENLLNWLNNYL